MPTHEIWDTNVFGTLVRATWSSPAFKKRV